MNESFTSRINVYILQITRFMCVKVLESTRVGCVTAGLPCLVCLDLLIPLDEQDICERAQTFQEVSAYLVDLTKHMQDACLPRSSVLSLIPQLSCHQSKLRPTHASRLHPGYCKDWKTCHSFVVFLICLVNTSGVII